MVIDDLRILSIMTSLSALFSSLNFDRHSSSLSLAMCRFQGFVVLTMEHADGALLLTSPSTHSSKRSAGKSEWLSYPHSRPLPLQMTQHADFSGNEC
jgi:hypothetical protein